jgi:hypothetical protein
MKRAREWQEKRHFFLPSRLVQLLQLSVLSSRAKTMQTPQVVDPAAGGALSPPLDNSAVCKPQGAMSVLGTLLRAVSLVVITLTASRHTSVTLERVVALLCGFTTVLRACTAETLMDVLAIVDSVLYVTRLPDALFFEACTRAREKRPRAGPDLVRTLRDNARWKHDEDEQVCVCAVTVSLCCASLLATPRHATPRHATPRHATPRHATPRHATPRHATSRHVIANMCCAFACAACTTRVFVLQLVRWVEDVATSKDSSPTELKCHTLQLTPEMENKYPALSAIPQDRLRFRAAIFQVSVVNGLCSVGRLPFLTPPLPCL